MLGYCKLGPFDLLKICGRVRFSSSYREQQLRVLDLDINYVETLGNPQDAHPILIIPGGLGSVEMDIKPIIPALNKQKYKWIGWDAPGHGKSRPPTRSYLPSGYGCSYELDNLGFEQYTIVGWSGGSITAMMMANLYPERISSLVTWGAFGFLGPDVVRAFKNLKKFGALASPEPRRSQMIEMYGEKLFQEMWIDALNELIAMNETDFYGEGGSYQETIKNIQCPALVIHGTKDAILPVSYAQHLNSLFGNSRLHLVNNGTHNLHLRETNEFVSCIQNFLDSVIPLKRDTSAMMLGYCKLRPFELPKFYQRVRFSSIYREQKRRVLDLDINYVETFGNSQDAHPVFILPGVFGSIEMDIKPVIPQLDNKNYKWIGWDPPGHGKSRPPTRSFLPPGYGCGYELDVKYAAELMKNLGFKKYSIVAWSCGSITAMMMANLYPERISSLVTWGAFGFLGADVARFFKNSKKYGVHATPEPRRTQIFEMYGEKLSQKMWNDGLNELIAMTESNCYREGGSYQETIKNVECPALVLHGTKDAAFSVSYAHHLNSLLRNSRLHLVENGTHNLHLRDTNEFVSCIEEFLDSVVS
ncbi:Valacyclovir hydrolase [Orchesella cincta]|uniref:Valacyclovir hydrolase n=1 Tax=Orchesella cincta TaxID=48709 RepID=A0A1D2MC54_ORCCI|nr:Valacyclovir hydrolase [Orchesella cincta]